MKAVILAGGSGSRLWPLSREMFPKQLLKIDEDLSLLQQTFKRIATVVNESDILTITNIKNYQDVRFQLNSISKNVEILSEPIAKNTAPAVATSLEYFRQLGWEDDIVIVVPSDHMIKDYEGFRKAIEKAKDLASDGYIVTMGIRPTYPEVGYGYIKVAKNLKEGYIVDKFVEKPNLEVAKQYVSSGDYYWNCGIFISKISVLLNEFNNLSSDIFNQLNKYKFKERKIIDYEIYEKMTSISIDYAIMEKSAKVALVEFNSDWNDLGSWKSIYEVKDKDQDGNVLVGNVIVENVKNSLIYSQKELVAVSGLEDVILVETEDAIMACKKENSQSVKDLFEKLKKSESETIKLHKTVFRPWGYYTCLNSGKGYLTKSICVLPKQKLSLQSHNYRSEHWVVLEGKALVIKGNNQYNLYPGDSIDIPVGEKHSLQNPWEEELKIIEVQKGDTLSEEDIIRYEDSYGRV